MSESAVTITVYDNGSYEVRGPAVLKDVEGNEFALEPGKDFWLCRCGHSGNKPFCDSSHKKAGFSSVCRAG